MEVALIFVCEAELAASGVSNNIQKARYKVVDLLALVLWQSTQSRSRRSIAWRTVDYTCIPFGQNRE
jgi:hypothetical protein